MDIFDGIAFAAAEEARLRQRVARLAAGGQHLKVVAILFTEDAGSRLYSRLKQEAAARMGIDYTLHAFSMIDSSDEVLRTLAGLHADSSVTGIIIQKPWRSLWMSVTGQDQTAFASWWSQLVGAIDEHKDVDGLHPRTLAAIERGTWRAEGKVMPATAKAVLSILDSQQLLQPSKKYIILGKSELLGQPLFYELKNKKCQVEMIGSKELNQRIEQHKYLFDADVVISATGRQHLITGELIKPGVALVDVGEPKPDIDRASVSKLAGFLTPVPGGVGPVTVVSLMANAIDLVE